MTTSELERNLAAAQSSNTRRAYRAAWQSFLGWVGSAAALPADPETVASYLSHLGARRAHVTLRCHAAAIADRHREAGFSPPTAHPLVRQVLAGHARRKGTQAEQAAPLGADEYVSVCAFACQPRITRGGVLETETQARRRGEQDIALIGLMRDAMLRRSEAAALLWGNIVELPDGSGRVQITRSKTDRKAEGTYLWVSPDVTEALGRWRARSRPSARDPIFRLAARSICKRIAAVCRQAGLQGQYSGHSPRVGMAQDLAKAGLSLPTIMQAGRWESPRMVSLYTRQITAAEGAVAQWYRAKNV
ncbi:tyrosine-type recombinase/integrase [Candidatus Poriferisocius sp.]|uniref:tyrosine-type recombinase/integrase n=1 Tax=Candidatus Poriferisocius sp. TaxID=3101276 RepID=UPI003B0162D1